MDAVPLLFVKLRKLLRSRGRSTDDTDDLIQEAFLRLQMYRREREVREPEAFLVRTTLNLAINQARQCASRGVHVPHDLETAPIIDPRPSPDEVVAAQERLQRLRAGLEALNPRTREVLLLHRIEGYSQGQIATLLGISVSAVEKHIAKATLFLTEWRMSQE
jgi:RNA polymerase sigma factor (sigma-70 family)